MAGTAATRRGHGKSEVELKMATGTGMTGDAAAGQRRRDAELGSCWNSPWLAGHGAAGAHRGSPAMELLELAIPGHGLLELAMVSRKGC